MEVTSAPSFDSATAYANILEDQDLTEAAGNGPYRQPLEAKTAKLVSRVQANLKKVHEQTAEPNALENAADAVRAQLTRTRTRHEYTRIDSTAAAPESNEIQALRARLLSFPA